MTSGTVGPCAPASGLPLAADSSAEKVFIIAEIDFQWRVTGQLPAAPSSTTGCPRAVHCRAAEAPVPDNVSTALNPADSKQFRNLPVPVDAICKVTASNSQAAAARVPVQQALCTLVRAESMTIRQITGKKMEHKATKPKNIAAEFHLP